MAAPLIALKDIQLRLGGREVLRGASLEVSAGEVVFAIGRSGAGKSVLSRVALGLLRRDAGRVLLLGEELDPRLSRRALQKARRGSALVTQHAALLSWLTLQDNVALPLLHGGRKRARQAAAEALETVGLAPKRHLLPGQASAGERQLTAVARALALRPRAVIFDEPTTGLTTEATLAIERQVRAMADAGAAVLVVSHDLDSLARCADRFALLVDGAIRLQAPTAALAPGRDGELDLFLEAARSAHGSAGASPNAAGLPLATSPAVAGEEL